MLSLTRRRLLQTLGFAGPGLALAGRAQAATGPVHRILFYVTSHGTVHDNWAMRAGHSDSQAYSLDLTSTPQADFSPILAPLASHKNDLMVIDGVGNAVAVASGVVAHLAGSASCQSGFVPKHILGEDVTQDGPSLDQRIAAMRSTPFRSLEWSLGGLPGIYDELGHALPWESDPVAAYRRLFPSQEATTSQSRVLDFAARQFEDVIGRLPAAERAKVELHRDLVNDLDQRLQWLGDLSCPAPGAPELPADLTTDEARYPEVMIPAFLDLGVVALSCGLTDVITLRVDDIPTATVGAPPGDLHADIAHDVVNQPSAAAYMTAHHTFHAQQVSRLLDLLAAIPDGEGTLLDHTLVVWHNELSTGDHLLHTVPFVLAGLGGVLNTGSYLRFTDHHLIDGRLGAQEVGTPHNKLLAAIGTAMGLDMEGHCGTTGVTDAAGDWLDCTGILPGVLR